MSRQQFAEYMMKCLTFSKLKGIVEAPKSKSIQQRVLICNFLSGRELVVDNPIISDDVIIVLNSLIHFNSCNEFYMGESGFALRVLPIIFSAFREKNIFKLSHSLSKRPYLNELQEIGLSIEVVSDEDVVILNCSGSIYSGEFEIDCSKTSQSLTALLMILPIMSQDSKIRVKNLQSEPYINLTIEILKSYNITITRSNFNEFYIPGNQKYSKLYDYDECDWSGASFLISAATIASEESIVISGLRQNPSQADYSITELLKKSNVKFSQRTNSFEVFKSKIESFEFDFADCPDLVPAIIPIAINSNEICYLNNVNRLIFKESNRIESLILEYDKLGISIKQDGKSLIVKPGKIKSGLVDPHNDHRIAMSLAVSALKVSETICISNPQCVSKSYPGFWNDIIKIGANVNE